MVITDVLLRFAALGAEWILWLLVALSVLSVAIMIERAIYFRTHRIDVDHLSDQLGLALRNKDVNRARQLVARSKSIECVVLAAGLSALPRGLHAVAESMASAKARERLKLESSLAILGTLGNNAPFIGLLGTVLGIIKASHDLTQAQGAQQAAAGAVMAGVFEALVATAVGLFVAIPAVVAYNIFQRRVRTTLSQVDSLAHWLLSVVKPGDPVAAQLAGESKVFDGS